MPHTLEAALLDQFRALIEARIGLSCAASSSDDLPALLQRRAAAHGGNVAAYLARLERSELPDEHRQLAAALTVAETYFFRNPAQLDAFRELAQRHLAQAGASARPFRVLSAGCATGEEAYSLAIVAREVFAGSAVTARVLGVDLNPRVLERARKAQYSEWSLRALSELQRARWFQARGSGQEVALDPAIRASVSFAECNLVQPDLAVLGIGQWEVIFCRNVLMYFSPEQARRALSHLSTALVPHGHLFLGHAENLRNLSHDFHLCHTHESFYYRLRTAGDAADGDVPRLAATSTEVQPEPCSRDWVDAIERATTRVQTLVGERTAQAAERPKARDLGPVLELMQRDRFGDALNLLGSAHADEPDPDRLLLEAALLAYGNRFGAAESACRSLLKQDELNAGAHYVLALCREAAGAQHEALHHDEVAAYLDPAFAMPHVHMGLLLRRLGQSDASRRALTQAHALLQREDPARLAMFGGGFGRSTLLALCAPEPPLQGELP